MSNLKKFALQAISILHLRDGNDNLMYADGPDGKVDESRPMRARLFGPGTKHYAQARAEQSNRNMDRIKKKGKSDLSAEDNIKETAMFLARCTDGFENIEVDGLTGKDLFMDVYCDIKLCFIPSQIDRYIGETANFTGASQTI